MRLLLDTHALIWWLADDSRLGSRARTLIADPGSEVLVSVVSLWEVVVKARTGKLRADVAVMAVSIDRDGFTLLNVATAHLLILSELPTHHRDPFDHLLIAQAIAENALFISQDRRTPGYPVRYVTCSNTVS